MADHWHSTADTAETISAGPTVNRIHVPGAATGGTLSLVEMQIAAGFGGPPPHVHDVLAHTWWVLDGEVDLTIGTATSRHGAGEALWVPAGTPHGFSTATTDGVRLLQVDTPRALDGYFRDLAAAFPPGTAVDPAVVGEIMTLHDTRPVATP